MAYQGTRHRLWVTHRHSDQNCQERRSVRRVCERRWTDTFAERKNRKSKISSAAKVFLDIGKESADAFPPLKSVLGGIHATIKHVDVRLPDPHNRQRLNLLL